MNIEREAKKKCGFDSVEKQKIKWNGYEVFRIFNKDEEGNIAALFVNMYLLKKGRRIVMPSFQTMIDINNQIYGINC